MALMMIFSANTQNSCRYVSDHLGFSCYQTDNIYQFLKYAEITEPDIVLMHFEKNFNNDTFIMHEIKQSLCKSGICPAIYLNMPQDFEGEHFFENINFENQDELLSVLEQRHTPLNR